MANTNKREIKELERIVEHTYKKPEIIEVSSKDFGDFSCKIHLDKEKNHFALSSELLENMEKLGYDFKEFRLSSNGAYAYFGK